MAQPEIFLKFYLFESRIQKDQRLKLAESNIRGSQATPLLWIEKQRGKDPASVPGAIGRQVLGISDIAKAKLLCRKQLFHLLSVRPDPSCHPAGGVLGGKEDVFQGGRRQIVPRQMVSVVLL